MSGDEDTVNAVFHRHAGILGDTDAFEDEGQISQTAQPFDFLPGQRGGLGHFPARGFVGAADFSQAVLLIAEVAEFAGPLVTVADIALLRAGDGSIHGEHDGAEPGGFGAFDQIFSQVVPPVV